MARLLSQTLFRHMTTTKIRSPITPIVFRRHRSSQSTEAQLMEIDLESLESSDSEIEVLKAGLRKLEDVIHGIIIQRSAPSWLPFIPGTSYWVPPKLKPYNFGELLGKLETPPLSEEERLSFSTVRGWPSSEYFNKGDEDASKDSVEVKVENESTYLVEVEVEVQSDSGNTSGDE